MLKITGIPLTHSPPLAIVVSRFNQDITDVLLRDAEHRLQALNYDMDQVTVIDVPGAVELPVVAKQLANQQRYAAIITLGAVIYGETPHFTYVCQMVSQGCTQIAVQTGIPVIFGVLTTDTREQAVARVDGTKAKMGVEAVDTALEMISVLEQITATA